MTGLGWGELRRELFALVAAVFAQARSRLAAFAYVGALLAEPRDRRSCWQLAEQRGTARRGGCRRCWPSTAGIGRTRWPPPCPGPAARPAPAPPPGGTVPVAGSAGQPPAWRDVGKLPATPPDGRLARIAAAPMTRAASDAGYAWSRWKRRHQARARWHHYHARHFLSRRVSSRG